MADQVYTFENPDRRRESNWISFTLFEVGILISGIAGIGAVVSAIMGLIGLSPAVLGAVATLSAGTAMVTEGGANAAGVAHRKKVAGTDRQEWEIAGGFALQALTGLAAIILGIFSILGYNPGTLLPVSALVMGAGLIATGISLVRRDPVASRQSRTRPGPGDAPAMHNSNGTVELLVGIGAGVLGILGLTAGYSLTFALIAMLALGAAVFFNGTSMAGKLFRVSD